jgi:hypothetical protein
LGGEKGGGAGVASTFSWSGGGEKKVCVDFFAMGAGVVLVFSVIGAGAALGGDSWIFVRAAVMSSNAERADSASLETFFFAALDSGRLSICTSTWACVGLLSRTGSSTMPCSGSSSLGSGADSLSIAGFTSLARLSASGDELRNKAALLLTFFFFPYTFAGFLLDASIACRITLHVTSGLKVVRTSPRILNVELWIGHQDCQ